MESELIPRDTLSKRQLRRHVGRDTGNAESAATEVSVLFGAYKEVYVSAQVQKGVLSTYVANDGVIDPCPQCVETRLPGEASFGDRSQRF